MIAIVIAMTESQSQNGYQAILAIVIETLQCE